LRPILIVKRLAATDIDGYQGDSTARHGDAAGRALPMLGEGDSAKAMAKMVWRTARGLSAATFPVTAFTKLHEISRHTGCSAPFELRIARYD
jgi:hypothetical protein